MAIFTGYSNTYETCPIGAPYGSHFIGRLLASLANRRLACKMLASGKRSSLVSVTIGDEEKKSFVTLIQRVQKLIEINWSPWGTNH